MNSRTCSDTGLRLVDGPGRMYRVAGNAPDRGPLNPAPRRQGQVAERLGWNRYDTVGLTIYGAAHRDTALTESVAYRAPDANGYAALRTEAAYLGIGLDELLRDLRQAGVPVEGLGSEWSGSHFMYELDAGQGEWVDIRHPPDDCGVEGRRSPATPPPLVGGFDGRRSDAHDIRRRMAPAVRTGHRVATGRHPLRLEIRDGHR